MMMMHYFDYCMMMMMRMRRRRRIFLLLMLLWCCCDAGYVANKEGVLITPSSRPLLGVVCAGWAYTLPPPSPLYCPRRRRSSFAQVTSSKWKLSDQDDPNEQSHDESSPTPSTTEQQQQQQTQTHSPSREGRRRQRQVRRRPINRKPKHYWTDPQHLRHEIEQFWKQDCRIDQNNIMDQLLVLPQQRQRQDDDDGDKRLESQEASQQQRSGNSNNTNNNHSDIILIPSERLLNHYQRHDLRAAIASHGGRPRVAELFMQYPNDDVAEEDTTSRSSSTHNNNNATVVTMIKILPGRWKDVIDQYPLLVKELVRNDPRLAQRGGGVVNATAAAAKQRNNNKSHQKKTLRDAVDKTVVIDEQYKNKSRRHPRYHWDSPQMVIRELYMYVDAYRQRYQRPAVWMPRLQELDHHGRNDLKQAIQRHFLRRRDNNGQPMLSYEELCCRVFGMVPYNEWYYFDGQLALLCELRRYMDEYCDGDYTRFPSLTAIQNRGYDELFALIRDYGGRKIVAARLLGVSYKQPTSFSSSFGTTTSSLTWSTINSVNQEEDADDEEEEDSPYRYYYEEVSWGPFDLVFAIRLLTYIRRDHLGRKPPLPASSNNPLRPVTITIPSSDQLLLQTKKTKRDENNKDGNDNGEDDEETTEGVWLDSQIRRYGGYENVARRLGLEFASSQD